MDRSFVISGPSDGELRLDRMKSPPVSVAVWGALPPGPYVAIVGTRAPSNVGREGARRLARELSEREMTIISGGALGVDSEAHEGALDAGGRTLVFAPAWLSHAYPKQNRELFERILERGGAYVSLAREPRRARLADFFCRNAAIVAQADALVVAQCRFKSGTKNAVACAKRSARPIFILPSPYFDQAGAGSNALIEEGARLVRTADQIVAQLGPAQGSSRPAPVTSELPADPVLRAVLLGARTPDEVVEKSGEAAPFVQHRLLLLTLEGQVSRDAQGLLRYHSPPHER